MSGYADDTAIYLRGSDGILQMLTILENFACVSGLAINRSKSIVSVLGQYDPSRRFDSYRLTLISPNEHCSYLGIQVGQGDTTYTNWDCCFRALYTRLVLAGEKTHTVEQRAC